ncbi:zinc finger protein 761-like [Colletes gigas]|uniref:zinc finger protein 761-like n=1 Tax=Colletes gigas TaxID=935657 RepID=UPI001C9ACC66|nr:zinc finger protein 761-like [Colletes gigas]
MFIVTKEIDSENISKLCRTCLREDGDKMVCLFVGPAGSSLAAKLRSLSCLEVWQGDGLPEKMCDRCVTRAESALLYREQCRAADRALRQAALKVSGLTSYATVSGCKLYQQNQGFVPLQNSHKTLKCIECGAVFMSYQELCAHSRLHLPYIQDNIPVQHMHIVESQNPYINFNFSHLSSNLTTEGVQNTQLSPLIRPNMMQMIPINGENPSRAACALHCSLCNHTFTNRTQLMSHNIAHSTENIDISCDNENIDICENSNQIPQNLSYERSINSVDNSIQNLSYQRSTTNDNNEIQNLSFSVNIDLEEVQSGSPQRMQNTTMHPESDILDARGLRFTKDLERTDSREEIDRYQLCPPNLDYKEQIEEENPGSVQSKKYKCEVCSKLFSQRSKLLTHQLSHSGQQPFKCQNCEKAYSSKSKLNAHMRLHTKTNVHRCKVCDKIFAYPSYLREHMKTHKRDTNDAGNEGSKSFECVNCKKRFRLLKNLKAHERLHTGKGLVQCEICDKRFSQTYNLKIHLRTHKGTRLHKCEYCNKCFVQKGNLVEHLRIHTKVKPFECKTCGKRFSQSSHLKNHEASHASLRQHQCRLCGKRFKLANHLKRHLTLHTGAKAYKCHQCDQLFSQAFSLTRHLKRHESHM